MVERNPQAIARRARLSFKAIAAALALTVAAAIAISIAAHRVEDASNVKVLGPVSEARHLPSEGTLVPVVNQ